MIRNREDLADYMSADKSALGRKRKRPAINDYIWKYEILLRKCEYRQNATHGLISRIILLYLKMRRSRLGILCGFEIPLNTADKGLSLAHMGSVIVSEYARIGQNCRIHTGVNIGADARKYDAAPQIGSNVYIGPGAKLFGAITIANGIAIGANAVVNRSFIEPNVSIGGIPAKVISEKGTEGILVHRGDNQKEE